MISIDAELPLEADEFISPTTDSAVFTQPPTAPPLISYFIYSLKLKSIAAYVLRAIYIINPDSSSQSLVTPREKQDRRGIVASVDSALNAWLANLPKYRTSLYLYLTTLISDIDPFSSLGPNTSRNGRSSSYIFRAKRLASCRIPSSTYHCASAVHSP